VTAKEIQKALALHFDYRANVVVPNCGFPGWEADLVVLRPSGWLEEVEVKVSIADLKRDFTAKTLKHRILCKGSGKWHMGAGGFDANNPNHEPIRYGERVSSYYDYTVPIPHLIRKFWFAVPLDLKDKALSIIPEQYGLLTIEDVGLRRRVCVCRNPRQIKVSRKLEDSEKLNLMRLAYLRYWDVHTQAVAP
jgi:hypothetical protein